MASDYTVLIADDSTFSRMHTSTLLEGTEFTVVGEAKNGLEATEMAKELKPDLVLLDITMPEMSGSEALKVILANDPDARVIMVSSVGAEEEVMACLDSGALSFLQKPAEQNDLLANLRNAVGAERGQG